jgi:hypothetical protein
MQASTLKNFTLVRMNFLAAKRAVENENDMLLSMASYRYQKSADRTVSKIQGVNG